MKSLALVGTLAVLACSYSYGIESLEDEALAGVTGQDSISLAIEGFSSTMNSTDNYYEALFYDDVNDKVTGLKIKGSTTAAETLGTLSDPVNIKAVDSTVDYLQITLPSEDASYSGINMESDLYIRCQADGNECLNVSTGANTTSTEDFFMKSIMNGISMGAGPDVYSDLNYDGVEETFVENGIGATNIKIAGGTKNTANATDGFSTGINSEGIRLELQLGNILIPEMKQRFSSTATEDDIVTSNFSIQNFQLGSLEDQPLNVSFRKLSSGEPGIYMFMNAPATDTTQIAGSGISYDQKRYVGTGGNCESGVYDCLGKTHISNINIHDLKVEIPWD